MIERQPFLIGASGTGKVVHIDLDSPRVSRTDGRAAVPRTRRQHRLPRAREFPARRDRRGHRGDPALRRRADRAQPARILRARHRVPRWRPASLRGLLRRAGRASATARRRSARQAAQPRLSAGHLHGHRFASPISATSSSGPASSMLPIAEKIREIGAAARPRALPDAVLESTEPLVLRGLRRGLAGGARGARIARGRPSPICAVLPGRDGRRDARAPRTSAGDSSTTTTLGGFNFKCAAR